MEQINIKAYLNRLFKQDILSKAEAKDIMSAIGHGQVEPHQTTALLTCYQMRQITSPELSGFREAMIDLALSIDFSDLETIDIVGTGGDGKNTFNISTLSSFLVAGAGYKVAKHGNKGVSSPCGSSNVLEHLGYEFSQDYEKLKADIEKGNFCFFHAPYFHPAMKEVVSIRRALQVKTFFNIMGPLLNPAKPRHQFSGVYSDEIVTLYQDVFEDMGSQYGVVYDLAGYDEISLTGPFRLVTNTLDEVMSPADLGLGTHSQSDLHGGDTVAEAAAIFTKILRGEGTNAQNEVVIANAGLAIQRFKPAASISSCINEARTALESGSALEKLNIVTNQ